MKTKNLWKWGLGMSLVTLPLLGCGQKTSATNPAPAIVQTQQMDVRVISDETASAVEGEKPDVKQGEAEQDLENAPAQIVSPAKIPTGDLSPAAAELVKLAQAGVEEGVMMAYVTNSAQVFQLTSDDIIYLNDVGVPAPVVTAMIQRDQLFKTDSDTAVAAASPAYTNQLVPAPGAPTPYAAPQVAEPEIQATAPAPVPEPQQQVNVSYTYFYDSLSPYGTWIDVQGYGLCWQPTVVAVNRGWQPYMDRGRWVYSDHGWYWASDYSWGWAPFHYGRWFQHSRWGWCWAPDTVWGPSWVSWRYSSDYCGWAPLPPAACYRPGFGFTYYGRSVGFNFGFGLSARHYAFVPVGHFYDRHPHRHRLHHQHASEIYHQTTVLQRYDRSERNSVINRGIPVERIRTATRTDIRPIAIRDTDRPGSPRIEREGSTRRLAVYRPELPQPTGRTRMVGEGVQPAPRQITPRGNFATPVASSNPRRLPPEQPGTISRITPRANADRDSRSATVIPRVRGETPGPRTINPSTMPSAGEVKPGTPTRETRTPVRQTEPLIIRGPNRSGQSETTVNPTPSQNAPNRIGRQPVRSSPSTPPAAQPNAPVIRPSTPAAPVQSAPVRQAPLREVPTRQLHSPPATPSTPVWQNNQRVLQPQTPRASAPVRTITPATPMQRQSAPVIQSPKIEQPRVYQPAPRQAPMRIEAPPTPRMESRQVQPQVRSVQPQRSSQPQTGIRVEGGNRPQRSGGGEGRRNR